MDPKAALTAAGEAICYGEADEARHFLAAYREWRRMGGFEPKWIGSDGSMVEGDLYASRLTQRKEVERATKGVK